MNIKLVASIISVIIGFGSFLPYLRDTFLNKTKPHVYTWLIWTITQGIATLGILYGQGGWAAALNLAVGTCFVFVVLIFSLKNGTKNITTFDTIILISALCAIFVWWKLEQPVIALMMICTIDAIGYIPTYRKSYKDPWSETLWTWVGFGLGNIFSTIALLQYNFLTLAYLITIFIANLILVLICAIRRRKIKRS
jgi:Ca2+/Na+ antiporter